MERVLKDDAVEEKGDRARMASFVGAMAISDLAKTTLGPKGMDKILQSTGRGRNVTVTNDGATILKSLHIDNPAAKVLVDISKVQDDEVGDGTTSVVVLAGELLKEAEKLINKNSSNDYYCRLQNGSRVCQRFFAKKDHGQQRKYR